ncbi:glutathione S-transferase family protein [Rheinheimera sp. UJ63]|uniref:glutathione S-transferase family protein n=1 Tax=Rheinheimera sp. UJ63 TaxID=2910157 RepID=UPI001F3035BB|nr:glutathione S-transferase family protein [Rheinheimera sp. UJ63]MCF4010014.1 glutathione S-transferase family protein [Rheinheimera sp. UJ63]
MSNITLYLSPGSCARVSAIVLEELELEFETQVVRFMQGEHKTPTYKMINPKGKVPVLIYHGQALTENVAIITFLNQLYGKLLPPTNNPLDFSKQLADLCFCSSTLHPLVTRIRMPSFFAGEDNAKTVQDLAFKAMDEFFQLIDKTLSDQKWWYSDNWSAIDAYLHWCFWRVQDAGYPVEKYQHFCDHAERMAQRPAVKRAIARDNAASLILESEGLLFKPQPIVR